MNVQLREDIALYMYQGAKLLYFPRLVSRRLIIMNKIDFIVPSEGFYFYLLYFRWLNVNSYVSC